MFKTERVVVLFILTLLMGKVGYSQELKINEILASNRSYFDEFSKSSDWFELYNSSENQINLYGYKISDDRNPQNAWEIKNMEITPQSHLLIFASGNDISQIKRYQSLIKRGDSWKYYIPTFNIGPSWRELSYNDLSWSDGNSGFGYGDGDDNTILSNGLKSLFLRKKFIINDFEKLLSLILHVDYDDAFIAYINGKEVARANIGTAGQETPYNATPPTDHEASIYQGGQPDKFDISTFIPFLEAGENILCIQAYNVSANSSDFSIIPFLTIATEEDGPNDVPPILSFEEGRLHTDFKLSASGETLYLFDPNENIIDSVMFSEMLPDISYGRLQDGSSTWVYFEEPSPESENGGNYYQSIITDSVQFSYPTGIYSNPIFLELSGGENIRYSLTAVEPTEYSLKYNGPILVNQNTLVKARIFEEGKLSRSMSQNYLIGVNHDLPVMCLNTENRYLWDKNIGMYDYGYNYENSFPYFGANFWEEFEYPFYISFYDEEGNVQFENNAGAKIFGGWSRGFEQKSFALFARGEYGAKSFDYPFFSKRPYTSFESFILRNSGNDWDRSFLRDAVMTGLLINTQVDVQAYRPLVTYLNGEYWGMYNMREKISENYIASLHGVDPDSIDLIEQNGIIKHGSNQDYIELREFIQNNSLALNSNYEHVTNQIDVDNYIEYNVAQIFYDNTDWPGNNIRCWKSPGRKWRWIMYDTDFGLDLFDPNGHNNNTLLFALNANGPDWPNPPWSTLFLRKMMGNQQFKRKFVNYFADALNSRFLPLHASAYIEGLADNIRSEIYNHRDRWGHYVNWENELQKIKSFFSIRQGVSRNFIKNYFNLPATHKLNTQIENLSGGIIQLNSLFISTSYWSGIYFENNPVTLTAHPRPGYKFDHWSGDVDSEYPCIDLNVNSQKTLKAHFVPVDPIDQAIVINEINYNSPDELNSSDYVELHNFSNNSIDISHWILKDDNDDHQFIIPENTIMEGWSYLVLCKNSANFLLVHPEVSPIIGDFDFGLGSDGDQVRLFDQNGNLMDHVTFLSTEPWPTEANGNGPTLELLSPELDNMLEGSWRAYAGLGTPGKINHFASDTSNSPDGIKIELFPNPLHDILSIKCLDRMGIRSIQLFDLLGSSVLKKDYSNPVFVDRIDLSPLKNGQYFCMISLEQGIVISKIIEKL